MNPFDPLLGDPRHLPAIRGAKVRGRVANTRAIYVRTHHGPAALDDLSARLGEEARAILSGRPPRDAWLPISTMMEIDRAIFEGLMGGDLLEMRRFGGELATFELTGFQKAMLKIVGTPDLVLGRLAPHFAEYVDPIEVRCASSMGSAGIDFVAGILPYYLCEAGGPGGLEAALTLVGARDCRVTQAACVHRGDPRCTWQITWRA